MDAARGRLICFGFRREKPYLPKLERQPGGWYVFSAIVGMARRAVPARMAAGGKLIRATVAFERVAPLHAARTSQRDLPTTLNAAGRPWPRAAPALFSWPILF